MPRGRPVGSIVRQNIVEILGVLGRGYGYEIHKIYNDLFTPCTRENVYYHLRKGVKLGEFEVVEVRQEKGKFSWGTIAEKTYYKLGSNAKPKGDQRISEALAGRGKKAKAAVG